MTLRVPNLMTSPQAQLDLQRIKQALAKTSQQITSGQAIVEIGDDPSGMTQILGYQASISLNGQYVSQADTAKAQLSSAETVMTTMGGTISRLQELAQAGMASGATPSSQAAIAAEVDSLRANLISLGNTQAQGRYIFAGTNTTQKPFDSAGAYSGNNNSISLDISQNASVVTNIPGDTLFFGGPAGQGSTQDLLAQVADLSAALKANTPAAIQAAYDNIGKISDRISSLVADVGSRQSGVKDLQSGLTELNSTLTALKSGVQSVDYPTAIVELNSQYVAQQASLSTMAKTNSQNLFSYLA